jgi:large subunit ribosomal protein L21
MVGSRLVHALILAGPRRPAFDKPQRNALLFKTFPGSRPVVAREGGRGARSDLPFTRGPSPPRLRVCHSREELLESLMYAVVKTGGKQYKVAPGEKLKVETLPADVGAEVVLDQVLMVGEGESVRLGQPVLAGASVKATVVSHGRHDKVKIFKMRRRKHYQKHQGHRQNYTELRIDSIVG